MPARTTAVGMERKLAAIFSTDVAGYSRLMGEDEEATIRTLTAYRAVISSLIQRHRGRVVDSPGDNLLAEFASVVDAVRCAVEIQHALKEKNAELPEHRQMRFRIGINLGDVIVEGERLYGDGVNIAARLESLAIPGGVCISGTIYDHIETKLPLNYDYQGEQVVKNIAKPVRVYRVVEQETAAIALGKSKEPTSLLPLPDKPSIVVLPFVNLSQDPDQEYFSDGLTEVLTGDLSKTASLFVIARNSAFFYKGKGVKVQDISRELGVRYVLEGSVQRAGERVRITVQLIDATTGHHLWAERYDRELKDIFVLQDEIVQKIVFALKIKLTQEEQERFRRAPTDNLEAYDCVLRGLECVNRFTQESFAQARQMFERALELDPGYAAAYAWLGYAYWVEWGGGWNPDPQLLRRAFEFAQKATILDDSLSLAHRVLGVVFLFQKQHRQAIAELERAIALDPNFADAYAELAHILTYAGQPEEAIRVVEKAMRLNPNYNLYYVWRLGRAYNLTGRYEEAIPLLKRVVIRYPDYVPAHADLAIIYSELGQEEEAQAEVAELLRINPNLSLEWLRQMAPFKDPAVLERFLTALRKAGLK